VSAIGLLLLLHLYIGWRVAPMLPGAAVGVAFAAWLVASVVLIPMAFAGRRAPQRRTADRWTWAGMLALGAFALLLSLTVARDALLLVSWPFAGSLPPLAAPSALAVPLLGAVALLVGLSWPRALARFVN
jgi:hypothetical protein